MATDSDVPKSVRVRCDDGNESRYRSIKRASRFYDCNNSDAIAYACNDVPELARVLTDILSRDDLTLRQRREISERLDSTAFLDVSVSDDVTIDSNR